ncbi:NUDIX domain-containing protein [Chryseobacterium sp. SNU WT5]|uniref:NUDIX hydrolase n=1 Tax=Chryseobacterium sp. SNU WT5 TaxID=2594269 RepID=UPI0011816076|nr:NUDIX domain-containing protein [Chryseobacterium sp. SNU WT5]QDP86179.1 NUDIX domain-containing protein [Chryseobacterium sp. SNU WT5]
MYKVFVNEKKLIFSTVPEDIHKKLRYETRATLEIAIDLLENTSCPELNIYGEEIEEIWKDFSQMFKVIEAAGGIVTNQDKEILFIRRLGKWDLAKGKIEKGESLEQAALREITEETGVKELLLEKFLNTTYHIYTERNGEKILKITHWFKVSYEGNEKLVPQLEEGISEVSWKSKNEIIQDVFPMTFRNIKLILENYWSSFK